jgi:uncharacterized membrane protein
LVVAVRQIHKVVVQLFPLFHQQVEDQVVVAVAVAQVVLAVAVQQRKAEVLELVGKEMMVALEAQLQVRCQAVVAVVLVKLGRLVHLPLVVTVVMERHQAFLVLL